MALKSVLVVDDEIEIVNSLREYLSRSGFNVITSTSADQAFDHFTNKRADLILSDIKMPGKSGIDLYKQCALTESTQPAIPFVLMTSYSDIIGAENAYSMGVSELIAKPFDLDSLSLVLNYLLNLEESIGPSHEKYYAVQIGDFLHSRSKEFDIYLKVSGRFVLAARSGQEFSEQRIENFAKRGATQIFLNSEDFAKYTDLQFALVKSLKQRPMETVRKTKVLNHLINSVSQGFMTKPIEKDLFKNSLSAFESYSDLALNNSQLTTLLNHLLLSTPKNLEKSAVAAILSLLVITSWKWNSAKMQSRIILSALLCDISLKNHPELSTKKLFEYSSSEMKLYEQHPMESFRILNQIPDMPEEIAMVALQHHENSAGFGFPQKLTRINLNSYSVIIHCVNEFVEALYNQKDMTQIQLALDHLLTVQGKMLNQQILKTLYQIFQLKVPKSLEDLLLPHQTSKLN